MYQQIKEYFFCYKQEKKYKNKSFTTQEKKFNEKLLIKKMIDLFVYLKNQKEFLTIAILA